MANLLGVVSQYRQPLGDLLSPLMGVGQRVLDLRFLGEEINHFGLEFFNLGFVLQGSVLQVNKGYALVSAGCLHHVVSAEPALPHSPLAERTLLPPALFFSDTRR